VLALYYVRMTLLILMCVWCVKQTWNLCKLLKTILYDIILFLFLWFHGSIVIHTTTLNKSPQFSIYIWNFVSIIRTSGGNGYPILVRCFLKVISNLSHSIATIVDEFPPLFKMRVHENFTLQFSTTYLHHFTHSIPSNKQVNISNITKHGEDRFVNFRKSQQKKRKKN
jgi:hypothetical protein